MPNLPPLSPFTIRPHSDTAPPGPRSMRVARRPAIAGLHAARSKARRMPPQRARLKRELLVLGGATKSGA
jgi:hypothetical protein